jgi:cellulose synthase/poly-beta-1,6-N-acetylglucosamine synthase-like glycosyltransferase
MFNWLFNLRAGLFYGVPQAEYGVSLYGVPSGPSVGEIFMAILKFVIIPFIIPLVLTIGILVYSRRKALSGIKTLWLILIALLIYFAGFFSHYIVYSL